MKKFKKFISILIVLIISIGFGSITAFAQNRTYTVVSGDSMWKIAVKYEVGLSEIISLNPQIKNPALIYPGQKLTIPNIDDIKALENQVIKLVNAERSKRGLQTLTTNCTFNLRI
jgi:spore coat assembly protein SafA